MVERIVAGVAAAAGLHLEVVNAALDNELFREGPQKTHFCLWNALGPRGADILSWELDDVMSSNRAAQFEAFLRWSLAGGTGAGAHARIPSLILVNRGGPHTLSRRGRRVVVVS